jgi:hypothetical protein
VDRISRSHQFFVEYQSDRDTRPDEFKREDAVPLGWALFIIAALSLGLWWGIWLAVSRLVSAFHG